MSETRRNQALSKRRLRKRKAKAGICYDCKNKAANGMRRCEGCTLRQLSRRNLGDGSRWAELKDLLDRQQHRCAYTGKRIAIGKNASIDHIFPTSRYPDRATDINNIRFVDGNVNRIKSNLSLIEFIALAITILNQFGYEVRHDD